MDEYEFIFDDMNKVWQEISFYLDQCVDQEQSQSR